MIWARDSKFFKAAETSQTKIFISQKSLPIDIAISNPHSPNHTHSIHNGRKGE